MARAMHGCGWRSPAAAPRRSRSDRRRIRAASAHQRGRDRRGAARRARLRSTIRSRCSRFVLATAGARAGLSDRELLLLPLHPQRRASTPATSGSPPPTATRARCNFAYGEQPSDWNDDPHEPPCGARRGAGRHGREARAAGLSGQRIAAARASPSRSTICRRSSRRPACSRADEKFLGPVFDEFGIRFFLVFNTRLKIFHFLLDETVPVADAVCRRQGQRPHPDRQAHRLCVLSVRRPENPDRRERAAVAAQHLPSTGRSTSCRRISSRARRCATRSSRPIPASKARSTGSAISPTAPAAI